MGTLTAASPVRAAPPNSLKGSYNEGFAVGGAPFAQRRTRGPSTEKAAPPQAGHSAGAQVAGMNEVSPIRSLHSLPKARTVRTAEHRDWDLGGSLKVSAPAATFEPKCQQRVRQNVGWDAAVHVD